MAAETVDGNDVLAVVDAVARRPPARGAGDGPTLLEFMTFRMRGHEEASGVAYVPPTCSRSGPPRIRLRASSSGCSPRAR